MSENTPGTPDSDPDHIDPAGYFADLVESGEHNIQLSEEQDCEQLREFIESVENSDSPADPGTNAMVRIARSILIQTESK
jgi:hypothetical protein